MKPFPDSSEMKFLAFSLIALFLVLAMTSCSTSGIALRQSGGGGAEGATAAFEAQKVDVEFISAWSRFEKGDRKSSANYLNRASSSLRAKGLSSRGVEGLARRVANGSKVTESDFDSVFAASHRDLAKHHRGQADHHLASNQQHSAGDAMQATAYHIEQSAQWSGQPLSPMEEQDVMSLRQVGNALQAGSGYLVKGSGYVVQGTGWVLGKGFELLSSGGDRTRGGAGSFLRGTGQGGETGSRWIQNLGEGMRNSGDWILEN